MITRIIIVWIIVWWISPWRLFVSLCVESCFRVSKGAFIELWKFEIFEKIDVYIFSGGLEANRWYLLIISNSNYKFFLPWRLFRFWSTLNWGLDKINGRFWNFGLERMNGRFWNFVFDSTNGRFSNFCLEMMNGRLSFKLWSSSMSDKTRAKYYKCKVWLVINI